MVTSHVVSGRERRDVLVPFSAAPLDGRPALLVAGGAATGHDNWARQAVERRFTLLAPPPGHGTGDGAHHPAAAGVLAFTPGALAPALAAAQRAGLPAGPLHTVERCGADPLDEEPRDDTDLAVRVVSVVCDGHTVPVCVARGERALGAAPFTGHTVDAADPLLHREDITDLVRAAHRDLGVVRGITATTVRLTRGGPRAAPTRGLLAASALLRAGTLATGVDLALAWADLAAGAEPDLTARRRCSAAVRFLYSPTDLVLDGLHVDTARLPGGVWEVDPLVAPGDVVRAPTGTLPGTPLALGIAVGDDTAACRRSLDLLPAALRVHPRRAHRRTIGHKDSHD